ncbi:MAG TPA: protein-glutamate O-methyltransferase, partial [Sulfurospirillum sp. UBA11407]
MQTLKLKKSEFDFLKEYIYNNIGISLSEQKIYLVQGRLSKRLKEL